jgi:hypothetical protein
MHNRETTIVDTQPGVEETFVSEANEPRNVRQVVLSEVIIDVLTI